MSARAVDEGVAARGTCRGLAIPVLRRAPASDAGRAVEVATGEHDDVVGGLAVGIMQRARREREDVVVADAAAQAYADGSAVAHEPCLYGVVDRGPVNGGMRGEGGG